MVPTVTIWRCKCGVRIKVLAELDQSQPPNTITISCPKCGSQQVIRAHNIKSLTTENVTSSGI
jgi:hypothetical protein